MALSRKTYNTVAGSVGIIASELAYISKIHWISRGDKIYTVTQLDLSTYRGTPRDLEVLHDNGSGELRFKHQFNNEEKINVVYEV
jgi:HSP90 family molecular chaperone